MDSIYIFIVSTWLANGSGSRGFCNYDESLTLVCGHSSFFMCTGNEVVRFKRSNNNNKDSKLLYFTKLI